MSKLSSLVNTSIASTRTHAAVAALAVLLLPSAANAVVYIGSANNVGGSTILPASYSIHTDYASAVSATGSAAGGSAYAYSTSSSPGSSDAYAEVDYNFQIHGPASPFAIPLSINANGYLQSSGFYYDSSIEFMVSFNAVTSPTGMTFPTIDDHVFEDPYYHPGDDVYLFDKVVMAPVNSDIFVTLIAYASSGGCCAADGTLSNSTADLDPIFSLVGDPAGYNIVGVPGQDDSISNPPATIPEPGICALMSIGLGLAGTALRRPGGTSNTRSMRRPCMPDPMRA